MILGYSSELITIESYDIDFEPFSYRFKVEGRFEIKSSFRIDSKTLIGKIHLPNQEIEFIDLVPSPKESCFRYVPFHHHCRVFRTDSFISLSADKYFSRELRDIENIPLKISFEFNTDNLPYFKSRNSFKFAEGDNKLVEFINEIKRLKIDTSFKYQNSFSISREKYEPEYKTVQVPVRWRVRDGIQSHNYENIKFLLPRYDDLIDRPIKEWFSIHTPSPKNISIHHSLHSIDLEDGRSIQETQLLNRKSMDWSNFFLEGGIVKNGDNYVKSKTVKGIFFPEKMEGVLNSQIRLIIENHGIAFNIKNHFSFNKDFVFSNNREHKVLFIPKYDDYFKDLSKFKFIDL